MNEKTIEVRNLSGQKLIIRQMAGIEDQLDIGQLNPGIYILRIYSFEGSKQIIKKFMVE